MDALIWIIGSGLAMSAIALVGGLTLVLREEWLRKAVMPLVALAAGTLFGGAVFHMLPESIDALGNRPAVWLSMTLGFIAFWLIEEFLHWHHCHRLPSEPHRPLSILLLIGDGLHNFLGGLAVAGAFLTDIRLGVTTWLVAAAHEIPQELGDFGVLLHSGWSKTRALIYNFISALPFLIGGLVAAWLSERIDVRWLLPFAGGNFLYLAAADLLPEIRRPAKLSRAALHFGAFSVGLAIMILISWTSHRH